MRPKSEFGYTGYVIYHPGEGYYTGEPDQLYSTIPFHAEVIPSLDWVRDIAKPGDRVYDADVCWIIGAKDYSDLLQPTILREA